MKCGISKKLNRINKIPIKKIIERIWQKIYSKLYHYFRRKKILKGINIDKSYFENWSTDIDFIFDVFQDGKQENIISVADKICNKTFNILGSGDYKFEPKIRWNVDFKTKFTWNNNYYNDIRTIDLGNNSDVKVPWELSRFQHIPTLGQAYLITGDEKYSNEFISQIDDWISENPLEQTVNWTCAMDVAIRACNWIVGFFYFEDVIKSKNFSSKFNKYLFFHGDFIYRNLENKYVSNNHYIADLVGLIWISMYFRTLKYKSNKIKKWFEFATAELEKEIDIQFYDDGFNFEASTAYHCFTSEMLLYTAILCKKNNYIFSDKFNSKLKKACEIIECLVKDNGLIPLIGDMDSGRFLIVSDYGIKDMRDFSHLIKLSIGFFENYKKDKADNRLNLKSFVEGGFYIFRNKEIYMIMRCGKNGTLGLGGHTHNDQLSFEFNMKGKDFIIDPGTYVYTADYKMRNLFRSTKYHNTLQIDNLEQNDFNEFDLFYLSDQTKSEVLKINDKCFRGRHFGFFEDTGFCHEREIKFLEKKIEIIDSLFSKEREVKKNYIKKIYFIFSPDVILSLINGGIELCNAGIKIRLMFKCKYVIEEIYISEEYGKKVKSNKLTLYMEDDINEVVISY